eukprot:jgi/Galph1/321/GphlegSOOS_G5140.1
MTDRLSTSSYWREGDEEVHAQVNETIRRHMLWARRLPWNSGDPFVNSFTPKPPVISKCAIPAAKFENLNEYDCVICSADFSTSTVSCLFPCLHRFCYKCIVEWLKQRTVCPLCQRTPEKLICSIQDACLFQKTGVKEDLDKNSEAPNLEQDRTVCSSWRNKVQPLNGKTLCKSDDCRQETKRRKEIFSSRNRKRHAGKSRRTK